MGVSHIRISKLWVFRSLVAVAAGLMVASFTMPWWTARLSGKLAEDIVLGTTLRIYAHGFHGKFYFLAPFTATDITPFYQTVLAWVYLAASVGLILYSTWLKGRKGKWLLGGIGLIYIAYATIAAIWIAIRTGDFGISLHGYSHTAEDLGGIDVYAGLQVEYYLAHACGLMCIALALLRNKIVGKLDRG